MSFRDDIDRLHDYTRKRSALLHLLGELTEDGMHAQNVEGDRTTGTDTVLFCWVHERDPKDCQRQELDCTGEPIPKATDPTGETSIRPDRARRQRGELEAAEGRIIAAASELYDSTCSTVGVAKQTAWIYVNHQGKARRPELERIIRNAVVVLHRITAEHFCTRCTGPSAHPCRKRDENGDPHTEVRDSDVAKAREKLGKVSRPESWCAYCGNEPPATKNPTTVKGNLSEPRIVGRSCYVRILRTGKAPTRQDIETLKRTGSWPQVTAAA